MSSRRLVLISAILALVHASAHAATTPCVGAGCAQTWVYIGTHGSGPGQGIFSARLNQATGELTGEGLAAEIDRPTWLARDPRRPVLYSVSETGNDGKSQGGVYSLGIDPTSGKLQILGRTASGGGGATHMAYDPRLSTLFVANFGGGQVSAIPVKADGGLEAATSVQSDFGTGPHRRQTGPHAHGVTVDPSGHFVLAPDLGADRIFVYRFDPATKLLSPADQPFQALPPASGPRHLVFSPDGRFAFLDTELNAMVYSFRWDPKAARLTEMASTAIDPPEFKGDRSAAEIATSGDGRFLYVSNRGENQLLVYAIETKTGALKELQRIDCGGQVPWSFSIDPTGRWMIVANETSSQLVVFAVDKASGRLSPTSNALAVPKPVSVAFFQP